MTMILIYVMAAGLLLKSAILIWRQTKEIQNLEGRVLSLNDSLIRSRSKEQSTLSQLIASGRKLKETQEQLAKAERAAIMPMHAQDHQEIRTELEVEVKAKSIHYAGEDNKAPERFIRELLLRELDPYISIDRRMSEIEAKITVLNVK